MSEYKKFIAICKAQSKVDILVLCLTFVLTVIFDLAVAIVAGLAVQYINCTYKIYSQENRLKKILKF